MKDFLLGVFYNIVSYNNFEFFPNNSFQFSIFLSLTYTLALLKPSYGLDYLKLNISLDIVLLSTSIKLVTSNFVSLLPIPGA